MKPDRFGCLRVLIVLAVLGFWFVLTVGAVLLVAWLRPGSLT